MRKACLSLAVIAAVLAPLTAYAGDLDLPPAPQLEAGNTAWLELAQQAASESATGARTEGAGRFRR